MTRVDIQYGDFGNGMTDMTVLSDGSIMASGNGDEEVDGVVARLELATGAYRSFAFGDYCPHPGGTVGLPDGDVVVNGSANGDCDASPEWFVTRYAPDGAKGWTFAVPGAGKAIAYGGNGVLVVGGGTYGVEPDDDFSVARLDPATGSPVWTVGPVDTVGQLAVDSSGDVYAEVDRTLDGRLGVVKRSVTDGSELWRYAPAEESFIAQVNRILVDAGDDVVVGGHVWQYEANPNPISPRNRVIKLRGGTGEVLWIHEYVTSWSPGHPALALAANGDVIAVGKTAEEDGHSRWRVERLGAGDGVPVWVHDATPGSGSAVAVTPHGDVVVTGWIAGSPGMSTMRLTGDAGVQLWRSSIEPICTNADSLNGGDHIGVAPDGTVIVGGRLCTNDDLYRGVMTAVALRADDGTLLVPPTTTTSTTVSTTTTTAATTTTSTMVPDGLCATLQRSGCLDDGTPRRLRRRLARLCAAEPGTSIERKRMRRIGRRLARIERADRLPAACLESLARHLAATRP